jgi:hypothetical protein
VGRCRGEWRYEFARSQRVKRTEAAGEFASGQLALPEERAEKITGAAWTFLGVTFPAAGDEVAVRIARVRAGDDFPHPLPPERNLAHYFLRVWLD